jgi:hypothetical protein
MPGYGEIVDDTKKIAVFAAPNDVETVILVDVPDT